MERSARSRTDLFVQIGTRIKPFLHDLHCRFESKEVLTCAAHMKETYRHGRSFGRGEQKIDPRTRKQSAEEDEPAAVVCFARRCFLAVFRHDLTRSVPDLNPLVFSVVIASEIAAVCGG